MYFSSKCGQANAQGSRSCVEVNIAEKQDPEKRNTCFQ